MARVLRLSDGTEAPRLGQGTWYLGNDPGREQQEIQALRTGIDRGMTLIDTAEMYGEGLAESLVGKAIQPYEREKLFLVSKVYPFNAGRSHIFQSCQQSLDRLGTDYLDLYLLHWRGRVPLFETVQCMEELVKEGKIRAWGVSNFDVEDMEELFRLPQGNRCQVNQVLYHLGDRGVEFSLLPWMKAHGVVMMAYCPMAQGGTLRRGLLNSPQLKQVASNHRLTPAQALLAFTLQDPNVISIPRTGNPEHAVQNSQVAQVRFTDQEMELLNQAFPPPRCKMPLNVV